MYTVTFILSDSQQLVHLTYDTYEDALKCADDAMRGDGEPFITREDDYKTTAMIDNSKLIAISISNLGSQLKLQKKQQMTAQDITHGNITIPSRMI